MSHAGGVNQALVIQDSKKLKRWCLNNVLAESSSDADGSAVVRVHVPPLNAVTVPVAT